MCGLADVDSIDGDDLVSPEQLPAAVRLSTGEDERDEDTLRLLSTHDVEAETLAGGFAELDNTRIPAKRRDRKRSIGASWEQTRATEVRRGAK